MSNNSFLNLRIFTDVAFLERFNCFLALCIVIFWITRAKQVYIFALGYHAWLYILYLVQVSPWQGTFEWLHHLIAVYVFHQIMVITLAINEPSCLKVVKSSTLPLFIHSCYWGFTDDSYIVLIIYNFSLALCCIYVTKILITYNHSCNGSALQLVKSVSCLLFVNMLHFFHDEIIVRVTSI
jgi:hypothetical protein